MLLKLLIVAAIICLLMESKDNFLRENFWGEMSKCAYGSCRVNTNVDYGWTNCNWQFCEPSDNY